MSAAGGRALFMLPFPQIHGVKIKIFAKKELVSYLLSVGILVPVRIKYWPVLVKTFWVFL
ncbi:hypothetical protein O9929_22780 [Vibrio lentus]|nr:hypothetical protein [Vibrio lentus]